jgi:hypothetical protein
MSKCIGSIHVEMQELPMIIIVLSSLGGSGLDAWWQGKSVR